MRLLFFEIYKIGLQFTEKHGTLQRPDNPHRDGFPYPQPGYALISSVGLNHKNFHQYPNKDVFKQHSKQ